MRVGFQYLLIAFFACLIASAQDSTTKKQPADLQKFLTEAEARLDDLTVKSNQAGWVQETYITDDTEAISAAANENLLAAISDSQVQLEVHWAKATPPSP